MEGALSMAIVPQTEHTQQEKGMPGGRGGAYLQEFSNNCRRILADPKQDAHA
jgi:hypothetical protein